MPELLFERLARLRQRVRYILWVYGLCLLTAVFFATSLIAGSIDWLWHVDDVGIRVLLDVAIVGSSLWVAWRFLWRPQRVSFSDVELASRIEKQHPDLEDSLSSTVQFLNDGQDQRIGSPELQQEVIRRTLDRIGSVNVESVIETRPVQRVAWWAFTMCLIVALVVGLNQATAATAMSRLMFPFSSIPWPRDVELQFVNRNLEPLEMTSESGLTVVQGETLELFVENRRGALPADLTLLSRRDDGKPNAQPMRQTTLWDRDKKARDIGGATLQITGGPIFFWARGGDGITLPLQIDVVPPPRIDRFQIELTPPDYLEQPVQTLSENVGLIDGWFGTTVKLHGSCNKPLDAILLNRSDASPMALTLSEDGKTFSGEFVLERAGNSSWWLGLRDRQGFENPDAQRYDIRVAGDSVPSVTIEEPETDLLVTAVATVPFRVLARDDLGLKNVSLAFDAPSRPAPAGPAPAGPASRLEATNPEAGPKPDDDTLELIKKPDGASTDKTATPPTPRRDAAFVDARPMTTQRIVLAESSDRPDQLEPAFEWELAPYQWAPGTRITVRAEATDWFDLGEPHIGVSNPRTLTIVGADEKRAELADRQAALLLDLERSAAGLETGREFVRELEVQVDQTGTLRIEDLDLLKRVELDQRQIDQRLADDRDGLGTRAETIRRERTENQVEDAASDALLDSLIGEVEFLKNESLPEIGRRLTEARKLSGEKERQATENREQLKNALTDAGRQQDQAIETLRNLLDDLSKWKNERNLNADLRTLTGEQQELTEATGEIGKRTLTKSFAELDQQERADLAKLAGKQQQSADHVDEFRKQLDRAIEELQDTSPEQARNFEQVRDILDDKAIAGRMRQAAASLNQNRTGEAVRTQRELLDEMQKIQDLLDNREITDTETLVKQLGEASSELDELRKKQESLQKQIDDLTANPNAADREQKLERLRREEEELRQTLSETVRRLRRLQSPSATSGDRAAQRMQNAEQAMADGDPGEAQEQIEEALDDLEQAQRELAADQKQVEESLAREQLEKLADTLNAMIERQQSAIDETQRLHQEYAATERWSRVLLKSVKNLADVQRNLQAEVTNSADRVRSIGVVALALDGAARLMERSAELIDEREVAAPTVAIQTRAMQRLAAIRDSLKEKEEAGDEPENQQEPGDQSGPKKSGPQGESFSLISQLTLIRVMQESLISRVSEIRKTHPDDKERPEDVLQELTELAAEQTQLADWVREMTSQFGDPDIPPDESELPQE